MQYEKLKNNNFSGNINNAYKSAHTLKVLHINTYDLYGGASQVAFELVHNIPNCTLLVKKKESDSDRVIQLKQNFLDIILLFLDKIIWKLGGKKSIKNMFSISEQLNFSYHKLKKIKEYREADIIHLHNIHGNYFNLSALKKIAAEKQIVWTLHDMWAITGGEAHTFENDNYTKGIGKTPYNNIYPLQNPLFDRRQHYIELKKKIYESVADKLTFVPVSLWLKKCVLNSYVYNKRIKVHLNYNGIDLTTFQNFNSRNWPKPRLLFFNIDSPFKGSNLFINILKQIQGNYELIIVGEPLKTKVPHSYIKYINNREDLNKIYNNTDILVFPSLAESFGLTVLEAMACGVCVICSDIGGIPEIINESTGLIFKSGDAGDLLRKINIALRDIEKCRQKGMLAEESVRKQFSIKKTFEDYENLYHEILDKS